MKTLLNLTVIAAGLLASTVGAHAEALRLKVPFAFTASGVTLPAGEYTIGAIAGSPSILLIKGSGTQAMVFARVDAVRSDVGLPVVFANEGADGMVLVSVRTSTASFELSNMMYRTNLAKSASLAIK